MKVREHTRWFSLQPTLLGINTIGAKSHQREGYISAKPFMSVTATMKDSDFVNSSSWPKLTEWCSSCTRTRLVKLVLPREEKVLKEEMFKEVATEGIK